MGGSPGDVCEVPMTQVKQRKGCIISCDVGKAAERLENKADSHSPTLTSLHLYHSSFFNPSAPLPTSQLILQPLRCFTYVIGTSPKSQLIILPFHCFTYVTGNSTNLQLLHLRHRHFTYFTWRAAHTQRDKKPSMMDQLVTVKLLSLEVAIVFGQLLRILLRAVNLFSFSHIVSSDSSFNRSVHNALYFVKYPSRAAKNSSDGRRRAAGRRLKTHALNSGMGIWLNHHCQYKKL